MELTTLPDDCIMELCMRVDHVADLIRLAMTNRTMMRLATSNPVWRHLWQTKRGTESAQAMAYLLRLHPDINLAPYCYSSPGLHDDTVVSGGVWMRAFILTELGLMVKRRLGSVWRRFGHDLSNRDIKTDLNTMAEVTAVVRRQTCIHEKLQMWLNASKAGWATLDPKTRLSTPLQRKQVLMLSLMTHVDEHKRSTVRRGTGKVRKVESRVHIAGGHFLISEVEIEEEQGCRSSTRSMDCHISYERKKLSSECTSISHDLWDYWHGHSSSDIQITKGSGWDKLAKLKRRLLEPTVKDASQEQGEEEEKNEEQEKREEGLSDAQFRQFLAIILNLPTKGYGTYPTPTKSFVSGLASK